MSLVNLPNVDEEFFRPPQLPGGPFMIEDQDGDIDGPFNPEDFVSDEHGVLAYQGDGRPIFLRVIHQQDNVITTIDGAGETWEYTLLPLRTT